MIVDLRHDHQLDQTNAVAVRFGIFYPSSAIIRPSFPILFLNTGTVRVKYLDST